MSGDKKISAKMMKLMGITEAEMEDAGLLSVTAPKVTGVNDGDDKTSFSSRTYHAPAYLAANLPVDTEKSERLLLGRLQKLAEQAAADLQRTVFANYPQFVLIAQAMAQFQGDLLRLRGLLVGVRESAEHFYGCPLRALQDRPDDPEVQRSRLKQLLEGMSNVPAGKISGDARLLGEDSGFSVIVDEETGEIGDPVRFFQLDTGLLVAAPRAVGTPVGAEEESGLYFLNYWPYQDVRLSGEADATLVLLIFGQRFPFKPLSRQLRAKWVDVIETGAINAEGAAIAEQNDSAPTDDVTGISATDYGALDMDLTLGASARRRPVVAPANASTGSGASRGIEISEKDISVIVELLDSLDEGIAHCNYGKAVKYVGKTRAALAPFSETPEVAALRDTIQERIQRLMQFLTHALANPLAARSVVKRNVEHAIRLGGLERARDAFLRSRSDLIRTRLAALSFDTNLVQYIEDIATVFFTVIRVTAEWFADAFQSDIVTSHLILWTGREIRAFANLFHRHTRSIPLPDLASCMKLQLSGLDIGSTLENVFNIEIADSLSRYIDAWKKGVAGGIAIEVLQEGLATLHSDFNAIIPTCLVESLVDGIFDLYTAYLDTLDGSIDESAVHVMEKSLIPKTRELLVERYGDAEIPDLKNLLIRLSSITRTVV